MSTTFINPFLSEEDKVATMEIIVLEESKHKLMIEIQGEDHTLVNALKKELWNDKDVKIAGYTVNHPSIGIPRLVVETHSEDPRKALVEAAKRLKKDADKLKKALAKEL